MMLCHARRILPRFVRHVRCNHRSVGVQCAKGYVSGLLLEAVRQSVRSGLCIPSSDLHSYSSTLLETVTMLSHRLRLQPRPSATCCAIDAALAGSVRKLRERAIVGSSTEERT